MIPRILIENIVNSKPIRKFGEGTATRTWIYISDIVSAFLCALKNPCGGFAEFNTGAPNSTTLNELIACAEKVVGKKAIIEQCEVPPGDAHTVGHPSYDLIEKTLGWTPKVDVEEGMHLIYQDYMTKLDQCLAEDVNEMNVEDKEDTVMMGVKFATGEEEKKTDGEEENKTDQQESK